MIDTNKICIWGTRRSGTTLLQDIFCNYFSLTNQERVLFSEPFSYEGYVNTVLNTTPSEKTLKYYTNNWSKYIKLRISDKNPAIIKTHFDNLNDIDSDVFKNIQDNFFNITIYRESWIQQVLSLALAMKTNEWQHLPDGKYTGMACFISKEDFEVAQYRLKKSYMDLTFKPTNVIKYEDLINQEFIFGINTNLKTHKKLNDKSSTIHNYEECMKYKIDSFDTDYFTLADGKVHFHD